MTRTDPDRRPEAPRSEDARKKPASERSTLSALLHHTVTALIVAVLLATAVWLYLRVGEAGPAGQSAADQTAPGTAASLAPLEDARRVSGLLRVERALEVARLTEGKYPGNLKFLLREGLLAGRDLYYPSGDPKFEYRRAHEDFALDIREISGHGGAVGP